MSETSSKIFNKFCDKFCDKFLEKVEDVKIDYKTDDVEFKNFYSVLKSKLDLIYHHLSFANHFSKELGTKKEHRFTVPHNLDNFFEILFPNNIKCVEKKYYDLLYNEKTTISTKSERELFHNSKKNLKSETKKIIMSNSYGTGQKQKEVAKFDILLLLQYVPCIVVGIVKYNDIRPYLNNRGVLKSFSIEKIKFLINPYEKRPIVKISQNYIHGIKNECDQLKISPIWKEYLESIAQKIN